MRLEGVTLSPLNPRQEQGANRRYVGRRGAKDGLTIFSTVEKDRHLYPRVQMSYAAKAAQVIVGVGNLSPMTDPVFSHR